MTRIVFATWGSGLRDERMKQLYSQAKNVPVTSILVTRANPREIEPCITYGQLIPGLVDFWLDSGAFSAWTKGHVYTAANYLSFVQSLIPRFKCFRRVFVISLDKIPGKYRQPVSRQDIQSASEQTLENTQFLIRSGLNVVPIHHQGEPLWVMKEYLSMCEYVGISPANDAPQPTRIAYVRSLLPLFINNKQIKPAHNFGNVSPSQLKIFPFYSADSQTWKASCMSFGRDFSIEIHKNSTQNRSHIVSTRAKQQPVGMLLENIKACLHFESDLKKLWAYRGISWQEPQGIKL